MFALHFDTDNAAFGDTEAEVRAEIVRILHEVSIKVSAGAGYVYFPAGTIHDANGNSIGEYKYMTAAKED